MITNAASLDGLVRYVASPSADQFASEKTEDWRFDNSQPPLPNIIKFGSGEMGERKTRSSRYTRAGPILYKPSLLFTK